MAGVILAGASLLGPIIIGVVLLLLIIIVVSNVVIVPQASAFIVERLGAYQSTWETGLHIKIPMIERIANKVTLKERVADFPPQPVITKDNVTMRIDTVVYFQVTDPKLFTYGIVHPMAAIENLTATTLRNIIGELELDETLTSRDTINKKLSAVLDDATDKWGVKVNRVELQDITPPDSVLTAMEKQMQAERNKRAQILTSEGQKAAEILASEGERTAIVNKAEAAKEQAILEAEGEAQARIRKAEAEAKAIELISEAVGKSTNPANYLLAQKYIQMMQELAEGDKTKTVYLPYEATNLLGSIGGIKELFKAE